jgi:hypothetical protein
MPSEAKAPPYVPRAILSAEKTRQIYGDGSFGGAYQVDAKIMDEIFRVTVEDILELLKFE